MTAPVAARRAGVLVPLFSVPSSRSWGIGEFGDLEHVGRWLVAGGQRLLQLLPVNELPPGESSPYSALSAMALDPQFLTLDDVEDCAATGGEGAIEPQARARLEAVRASPIVRYAEVRRLKDASLRRGFVHFVAAEWSTGTRRAEAFRTYLADEAWWLEDYALFRALHARYDERPWTDWPTMLRTREPRALALARVELARDILYRQYLQWLAAVQWQSARARMPGVEVFGDLPFMVGTDSADVWARQDEFRLDASVGVPPDAFSATGQDWGLPLYRWDVIGERDFGWLRDRARRNAELFDGYRVDHLVGFYRTYFRPADGTSPRFTPDDPQAQVVLGERILGVFRASGAEIVAEDLGIIPEFVRASLTRLAVPGFKVFRWERHWDVDQQPFVDPRDYPAVSVATSGTHDTEPMAVWWEAASPQERAAVLAIPSVREHLAAQQGSVLDAVLEAIHASGSDLVISPIQDVFGWRDRINQPATVADTNWTWKLPWPSDQLSLGADAVGAAGRLRRWCDRHRR